jgi:cholesterol oxidase
MLGSARLSPPSGYGMPPRTQAFRDAAEAAGRRPELVPIAVYTGEPRLNPHGGVPQEPCDYSGDCLLGCRLHAKNTLDLTYLPLAERKHGLEIYPLHQVDAIEPLPAGGYRVTFDALHPDTPGGEKQRGQVIGAQVVVAAGSLGSTHVLLRSRDVAKTLPGLSPMLGKRFSGNGDMILAGTLHANRIVDPGQGPSITAGADFSRPGSRHRIFIEDLGFPNPFMWLLEGQLPSLSRAEGLLRAAGSYVGAAVGIHSKKSPMQFQSEQLFAGERTARFLPYLGMGTDAGDGVLRLDAGGDLELDWDSAASMEMFREMEEGLRELSGALDGIYLRSFLWDVGRLLTAHPLGGCVMGDSAATGVVNDLGEVYGYPGLFVADGAIVPGAPAVNPSLTISALAERAAYWMIHGEELTAGKPTPPSS